MRKQIWMFRASVLAAAGVWAGLTSVATWAQAPTPDQMTRPPQPPLELKPLGPAPQVETERAPRPTGAASTKTVTVNRFEFVGNTLFSAEELEPAVAPYMNRPVTLLEILDAGDKVADFYVRNGYSLASVNVPPQKIEGGIVRLLISEGRVAKVTVEGNQSYDAAQLGRYLGEIQAGSVYRGTDLNESMRIINTLPGLTARAIVRPGERYGTSELVIKTTEKTVAGALIVDNHGRANIGEMRVSAFTQFNNPLGVEDQLQLLALQSEDSLLTYGYAAYGLPVNFTGTRFTGSYGYADFEVGGSTPVRGRNRSGRVSIDHPLLATRTDRLNVNFGATRTRSNADLLSQRISGTDITLLEVGGAYTHTYSNLAVSQVNTNVASNFDKQDRAALNAGGLVQADQRLRMELDFQHLQPLPASLQLLGRFNGVYSPDPLPDTSQFSLGGPTSVRGSPPSELRGDSGYLVSASLMRPFSAGQFRLLGRAFADAGQVFAHDPNPGQNADESLVSVGVGADANLDRVSMKLDCAFPLDNHVPSDGRDTARLYGSLSVSF